MSKAATPKPQPAARRMKPQHYKPGIDAGRIRDLREAVESDRELTRAERVDISQALLALNDFIMHGSTTRYVRFISVGGTIMYAALGAVIGYAFDWLFHRLRRSHTA